MCDGMTIDDNGNVYLTIIGVNVYSAGGKLIKNIKVPEGPTNVCFGGKDRKTLFITTPKALYSVSLDDIKLPK